MHGVKSTAEPQITVCAVGRSTGSAARPSRREQNKLYRLFIGKNLTHMEYCCSTSGTILVSQWPDSICRHTLGREKSHFCFIVTHFPEDRFLQSSCFLLWASSGWQELGLNGSVSTVLFMIIVMDYATLEAVFLEDWPEYHNTKRETNWYV